MRYAGIAGIDEMRAARCGVGGYDTMGSIAVCDMKGMARADKLHAAHVLLSRNKHLATVLEKAGAVTGRYRTRRFRYVAGARNYMARHRENGCVFVFDVRKAFFSPRLSYERGRVAALVKGGENVIVMFAGVGPFAIEIAKAHSDAHVVAIELNRSAYAYMTANIKLNRLNNLEPVLGDVRRVSRIYSGSATRVVMPLPASSLSFLDEALEVSGRRSVVHLYSFGQRDTAIDTLVEIVKRHAEARGYAARRLFGRVVTDYSASEVEVVLDYGIQKRKDDERRMPHLR